MQVLYAFFGTLMCFPCPAGQNAVWKFQFGIHYFFQVLRISGSSDIRWSTQFKAAFPRQCFIYSSSFLPHKPV